MCWRSLSLSALCLSVRVSLNPFVSAHDWLCLCVFVCLPVSLSISVHSKLHWYICTLSLLYGPFEGAYPFDSLPGLSVWPCARLIRLACFPVTWPARLKRVVGRWMLSGPQSGPLNGPQSGPKMCPKMRPKMRLLMRPLMRPLNAPAKF